MAIKKKKSIKTSSTKTNSKVKKATAKKAVKKVTKKASTKTPIKKSVAKKKVVKKGAAAPSKAVKKITKKVVAKKAAPKKAVKKVTAKKVVAKKTAPKKTAPVKKEIIVKAKPEVKAKLTAATPKTEPVASTEKFVKIGVKTKKQLVPVTPQPVIEVSNHPKTKIKTLLISQPKPENEKNPYYDLAKKYNLIETFRQFIKIEGLPVKDFRSQRIDILEHKAVILTSRMAVDHYFRMCNEMRVTVPESMKYF